MTIKIFGTNSIAELWKHLQLEDTALVDEELFNHYLDSGHSTWLRRNRFRTSNVDHCAEWSENYEHECFMVEIFDDSLKILINDDHTTFFEFSRPGNYGLWTVRNVFEYVPNDAYQPPEQIGKLFNAIQGVQFSTRKDLKPFLEKLGFTAEIQ